MVPFRPRSASITDALDYEIAQEQAAALGRAGRALEAALAALNEHDRKGRTADETRRTLVADAGDALWRFIIQRESCGLRDPERCCAIIGFRKRCKIAWGCFLRSGSVAPSADLLVESNCVWCRHAVPFSSVLSSWVAIWVANVRSSFTLPLHPDHPCVLLPCPPLAASRRPGLSRNWTPALSN
jgi:uncharacterized protein DUF6665